MPLLNDPPYVDVDTKPLLATIDVAVATPKEGVVSVGDVSEAEDARTMPPEPVTACPRAV